MPLPILEYPAGITGQLGLKSGGQTPRLLGDQVAGVINLDQAYGLQRWENLLLQDTAPAVGTRNLLGVASGLLEVVPPGETWWIRGYRGQIATAGATAIKFLLGVRPKSTTGGPIYFGAPYVAAANETAFVTADAAIGLYLPAGTSFCVGVNTITGAPGTVFAEIWFARYRV